jgi:hypothetical protein
MKRTVLVSVLVMVAFAAAIATVALTVGETQAAVRCSCPQVFSPVLCSNGQVYDNSCWARCDGQKHCKYIGP